MKVQDLNKKEMKTVEGCFDMGVVAYAAEKVIEYALNHPEQMGGLNKDYKLGHVGVEDLKEIFICIPPNIWRFFMKKIYTFYEKYIYSANSVIFLLKSCFFLLLSIFVNVIINDLFNLDIASNSTASSMKKYSKWVYMLVIIFIIPVFETVIYQWLPVFIYTLVRPNNNKEYNDLLFSFYFFYNFWFIAYI